MTYVLWFLGAVVVLYFVLMALFWLADDWGTDRWR